MITHKMQEVVKRLNQRFIYKADERSKDGKITGASETPENLGFIKSDMAGVWSVTDKFKRLYEL